MVLRKLYIRVQRESVCATEETRFAKTLLEVADHTKCSEMHSDGKKRWENITDKT